MRKEIVEIPRDILTTITILMNLIPDEKKYEDLFNSLEDVKTSAMYAAPEMATSMWQRLTLAAFEYFGETISKDLDEWEFAFMAVLSTETIDSMKARAE